MLLQNKRDLRANAHKIYWSKYCTEVAIAYKKCWSKKIDFGRNCSKKVVVTCMTGFTLRCSTKNALWSQLLKNGRRLYPSPLGRQHAQRQLGPRLPQTSPTCTTTIQESLCVSCCLWHLSSKNNHTAFFTFLQQACGQLQVCVQSRTNKCRALHASWDLKHAKSTRCCARRFWHTPPLLPQQ